MAALVSDYRRFAGRRLWLALALMILGALAEGFGLIMIVPLASIAIDGRSPGLIWLLPSLADWTSGQRFSAALALFLIAMAARSILLFIRDELVARLTSAYEADLRIRAISTLASRGWAFASRIGQAGMQSLLLSDVRRAAQAINYLQNMAVNATMLIVALALTTLLSVKLAAVAVMFLAAAYLLSRRIARRGVASGFAISEKMDAAAGSGFRLHAGLKAALAQGTVAAFLGEYRSSLRASAREYRRFVREYSSARYWAAFGAALAAALLLFVGIRMLGLPLPLLIASLALFARMSGPAQQLQSNAFQAAADAPAFAAIERRLGPVRDSAPATLSSEPLKWQRLVVDDVSFEHRPGLGIIAAALELEPGAWVGIHGASGAGKTTLLDLVAGLLAPQSGSILIDGRSLKEILPEWRAALAYVGQDGAIFDESVRANLLAEGIVADDVDMWEALEIVGLTQRVRALPAGLNELVGDRGSQLSGGERQRLALARALLRRPTMLILDEATAALDPEAEERLIERLKRLEPRPAALVVAHRRSTLSHCDSVVSIQHGEAIGAR